MSTIATQQAGIPRRNMILIGVSLAITFWLAEALIHTFIFDEGQLLLNLFPTEPNELWMRTLVCFLLISFGIYGQSAFTKLAISEYERRRLQDHTLPDLSAQLPTVTDSPMISLGVFAAMSFWILESLIHSSMFGEGDLLKNMLPTDPNELWMRLLVSCLLIALGIYAHFSITKLKRSEAERLALQKKLEDSLTKMLSGFIPICANCKNIREADDTWIQIEGYIQKHSDVQFSHGICPKCAKLLYPDFTGKR
ncbi:MAG: hypothetical protein WEF53_13830 [Bacteroidota bacterium]